MFDRKFLKDLKSYDYEKLLGNEKLVKSVAVILAVLVVTMQIRGCIAERRKHAVHPRPVQVATAVKKDVPIYIDSFGTLTSINSADVKAQVTGEVKEVHFKEGDKLEKGDLLFVIDPDPYQALLKEAEAALAGDLADFKLKKDTYERNKELFGQGLISKQEYEGYLTEMAAAEAKVELDKANVKTAKINLNYCYITSPVKGLAGKRQVDIGNVVPANTGPTLVNVKTMEELYVDFTVPEGEIGAVRESMAAQKPKVRITIEGQENGSFEGELDFIDNTIDDVTGTVSLRATIPNEEQKLWPGQFARVRLILGTEKGAVIVPFTAVQLGKKGYYAFVINRKKRADLRLVTVGSREGNDIIVKTGIKAGETVVTAGQMGLAPGLPVVVREAGEGQEPEGKRRGKGSVGNKRKR
ncbi:MAG: efflux RND transporter periplasmic adaptor subunit [Candidatus Omnitrophota bacterium]|jgi:multidrug efflux system membrane fusion protein